MEYKDYLKNFDYVSRKAMKIQIPELIELLKKNEVQFIDVRFREEFEMWKFPFSKNIPNGSTERSSFRNSPKRVSRSRPEGGSTLPMTTDMY
ncbi:MAG TPA: rhodanese-like domain-containing protein [Campylobacteraceae bacterium]|nr:rhodanese-like domain-containing protein [Campylobacteraceae bacterium]